MSNLLFISLNSYFHLSFHVIFLGCVQFYCLTMTRKHLYFPLLSAEVVQRIGFEKYNTYACNEGNWALGNLINQNIDSFRNVLYRQTHFFLCFLLVWWVGSILFSFEQVYKWIWNFKTSFIIRSIVSAWIYTHGQFYVSFLYSILFLSFQFVSREISSDACI